MTTTHATTIRPRHVRTATPADITEVGGIIAAAFQTDPVMCWVTPDPQRRAALSPAVFALYASGFVPLGHTYLLDDKRGLLDDKRGLLDDKRGLLDDKRGLLDDGVGAALWAAPGQQPVAEEDAEVFGQQLVELVGEDDASRLFELDATFEAHTPSVPHWHLQLVGTVPERQGEGVGSALLRHHLEQLDQAGQPAYLEATSPQNRRLYERHGFVATGEITLPDGPTLTAMWRDPAA